MKKSINILFLLLLFLSCQKESAVMNINPDDVTPEQPTESIFEYLNNYNGQFINDWMPDPITVTSDCPSIINVDGNDYVIPGGNNKLSVHFYDQRQNVCHVLYGVCGVFGYYNVSVLPEQVDVCDLVVILSQIIKKTNFTMKICLEDEEGNISKPYYLPIVLKSAQPGDLQISLSFDQHNDLDLHVIEPDGFEIYWHDTISPNGGILDLDANANCVYDSVNNENVVYTDTVPLGCFEVWVVYYKQCIAGVNTNFTVTALYNGQPISLISGANPYSGTFPDGMEGYACMAMKFDVGNMYRVAQFQYGRYGSSIIKQEIIKVKPPE